MDRWAKFVKDYLSFSKGERRAVLVLLLCTLLLFVLPYWWPVQGPAPGKQAKLLFPGTTAEKPAVENIPAPYAAAGTAPAAAPRPFFFDPNTLDAGGWKRLGLGDKTIRTILHYREKGGFFRRPEDIGHIYGLAPADYARLLPFVKMPPPANTVPGTPAYRAQPMAAPAYRPFNASPYGRPFPRGLSVPRSIDVNTADTSLFIALPGIGSRLATRIVSYRERLGGFYCVEQVGETWALPDSVFQAVKGILHCDSNAIRRININTADMNALRQHPYIRWNIANAIVAYRNQHGEYKSVDELLRIEIITPEDFSRMRPYLYVP